MYETLALLAVFALLYSILAHRIERSWVTGPMVFLAFGLAVGPLGLGWLTPEPDAEVMKAFAELTLALVLFTDAAGADLRVLGRTRMLPIRLLVIGLPLTILLGFAAGEALFPSLSVLEVALLAILLAPTDAALGKGVVSNPDVPDSMRQGLNAESGLNDGICVPILFLFLELATRGDSGRSAVAIGLHLLLAEVGVGLLVGGALTAAAVWLLRLADRRDWLSPIWLQVSGVALAFSCFAVAQLCGGSGFIAAFAGGMLFGILLKPHREKLLAPGEGLGEAFALLTWVLFGAAVVSRAIGGFHWTMVLYAILSLTVIRMLPVFLALTGMGIGTEGKLFLGWFGPRGLASIVFVVIVIGERLPHARDLAMVVVCTVTLSIVGHGVTANPWARAFGKRIRRASGATSGESDRMPE